MSKGVKLSDFLIWGKSQYWSDIPLMVDVEGCLYDVTSMEVKVRRSTGDHFVCITIDDLNL